MKTQRRLAETLKDMMATTPIDNISVTTLSKKCGINRQTFYYHFHDVYDLLTLVFLNEKVEKLDKENQGLFIYNLGTGTGYSVLQLIKTFERVNNIKINYEITDRRPGDIDSCYSDPLKSKNELNFQTKKSLDDMCKDAWNFEKNYHK